MYLYLVSFLLYFPLLKFFFSKLYIYIFSTFVEKMSPETVSKYTTSILDAGCRRLPDRLNTSLPYSIKIYVKNFLKIIKEPEGIFLIPILEIYLYNIIRYVMDLEMTYMK